jgi:hypothetical protein
MIFAFQKNIFLKRLSLLFSVAALLLGCYCDPTEKHPAATHLPQLLIHTNAQINREEKIACDLSYIENGDTLTIAGKIKYRGASSGKYLKHSFSLELSNRQMLGQLPVDKDWILNASYIDKTFMRHKLCFDLFREMDRRHIVAQCAYVWINENNAPQGLYVLMEEIDKSKVGLNKKDPQAMLFKEPPLFYKGAVPAIQDSTNFFQQKFPRKAKSDKTTGFITAFQQFLFQSSDAAFASQINSWVDLENIIDWHILLLFSNNQDGLLKNFYLYKLNSETPFRIIPWDYDHSFGRDGDNTLNLHKRHIRCEDNILLDRLMSNPTLNYKSRLAGRWNALRKAKIISLANIQKHLDANDRLIRNFIADNNKIWPVTDLQFYKDKNNYAQELNLIYRYTRLRIIFLDNYFRQLSAAH